MAGLRRKRWTTDSGEVRYGWEVTWYVPKPAENGQKPELARKTKLFSGAGALAKAKRFRDGDGVKSKPRAAGTTIEAYGERWWRHVRDDLKRDRSTWSGYKRHLEQHIGPALILRGEAPDPKTTVPTRFGDIKVADLEGPDCERLKQVLLKKVGIKLTTVLMTDLRMLLNFCISDGGIKANVATPVKVKEVDRGEGEVVIPQPDEVRALLKAVTRPAPAPPSFTELWTRWTMITGMRPSENRGVAIEDLVLTGKSPGVHVRRRADEWRRLGAVKTKHGRRFIPLPPGLIELVRRWLLVVPRGPLRKDRTDGVYKLVGPSGVVDPETGDRIHLLFPTSDGTVQSLPNIFNRAWAPALVDAELVDPAGKPRYPINCLRHLAASLMIEDGLNEKQLQVRMGHSSIKVTLDLYGHLFNEAKADASSAARIEARFK